MTKIEGFSLRNNGAFIARLGARWSVDGRDQGPAGFHDDADTGFTIGLDLSSVPVPVGSAVWIDIDVIWGKSRQGSPDDGGGLTYAPGCGAVAAYEISGTTLDTHLRFLGTGSGAS